MCLRVPVQEKCVSCVCDVNKQQQQQQQKRKETYRHSLLKRPRHFRKIQNKNHEFKLVDVRFVYSSKATAYR